MLACALGAGYLSILENIDSLSAEYGVVVGGSQCIGKVCLVSDPIAAVLRLPVNSIAGDAKYSFLLRWWCIVPSREFKAIGGGSSELEFSSTTSGWLFPPMPNGRILSVPI